jgi:hypothetical protein
VGLSSHAGRRGTAGTVALGQWWVELTWSLAQSLRRYAAWAAELLAAGAVAAATLTPLEPLLGAQPAADPQLGVTAAAALWLAVAAAAVAVLRRHDPIRHAGGWREAGLMLRRAARRHPLATLLAGSAVLLGTLDEAGAAPPAAVQQLLQLGPTLAAASLAGFGIGLSWGGLRGLAERWRTPQRPVGPSSTMLAPAAAAAGFVFGALTLPGLSGTGMAAGGSLLGFGGAALAAGVTVELIGRRRAGGWLRPSPAAVLGAVAAGAATRGGTDLLVVAAAVGGVLGATLEAASTIVRSQTILWRHRERLPLEPGEVVYSLEGRSMEITLEGAGPARGEPPGTAGTECLTEDGWRVSRLTAACWEGTKGRAHLLGRRPNDLLGVIRVLHPEA